MLKLKLKRDPSEGSSAASPAPETHPQEPRLKLSLHTEKKPNAVRLRLRTRKPQVLDGYDIEAADREDDPTIEEAFVLRMLPNTPALENLRRAVSKNDFSGVSIKFEDRRHAIVSVAGDEYHAQLMDLPTLTEVHKTVDRRNIFKTVDVSQILLVTHRVDEPRPNLHDIAQFTQDPQAYPHGLTPPMYNARNRRFQPRVSTRTVESVEAQVEELLKRDAEAKEVKTELLPASAVAAQQALAEAARAAARARTEESDMDIDDDLDEELERAMMNDDDDGDEEDGMVGKTAGGQSRPKDDSASDGDEDVDGDDDDDDDDNDERGAEDEQNIDEDVRQHNKQLREEIRELEVTIQAKEQLASSVVNEIMRARHVDAVTRLRAELEKKKGLLRDSDEAARNDEPPEDEEEEEEDDDDDDDDDDAPEMPEGAELPEVPTRPGSRSVEPSAVSAGAALATPADESNSAELQLREQLQLNNDDDIDIDDLF